MKLKSVPPSDDLKELTKAWRQEIGKYPNMPATQILAAAAQLVGQLIALQDHRTMTVDEAMQLVSRNIEEGNLVAVQTLLPKGERH